MSTYDAIVVRTLTHGRNDCDLRFIAGQVRYPGKGFHTNNSKQTLSLLLLLHVIRPGEACGSRCGQKDALGCRCSGFDQEPKACSCLNFCSGARAGNPAVEPSPSSFLQAVDSFDAWNPTMIGCAIRWKVDGLAQTASKTSTSGFNAERFRVFFFRNRPTICPRWHQQTKHEFHVDSPCLAPWVALTSRLYIYI